MSHNRGVRPVGYTQASTASQDAQLQLDALLDAGVQKRDVFSNVRSGRGTAIEWPGMKRLLDYAGSSGTLSCGVSAGSAACAKGRTVEKAADCSGLSSGPQWWERARWA